jgi:hypothetical protein
VPSSPATGGNCIDLSMHLRTTFSPKKLSVLGRVDTLCHEGEFQRLQKPQRAILTEQETSVPKKIPNDFHFMHALTDPQYTEFRETPAITVSFNPNTPTFLGDLLFKTVEGV